MKIFYGLNLSCLVGLAAVVYAAPDPEAWPRFRGPNGAGLSTSKSIPVERLDEHLQWRVAIPGRGHSSPVIWGGRVFLTTTLDAEEGTRAIRCHKTEDGSLLWEKAYAFTPYRHHLHNDFSSSTPFLEDNRLYHTWTDGETIHWLALDHDGNEIWKRTFSPFLFKHGSGVSPVAVGDVLLFCNDHEGPDGYLMGLSKATGETVWKRDRERAKASYGTPMMYTNAMGEKEAIFVSMAHGITSLKPADGTLNWEAGGPMVLRTVASPILADGLLISICGSGGSGKDLIAVRPGEKDRPAEVVYHIKKSLPYSVTPVAYKDLLFLWADRGGIVTCVKARTGEVLWRERVGGDYYASPLCIDGKIYGINRSGTLTVIEAAPVFKKLASYTFSEGTQATPAVYRDALYVRTRTELIRLEK
jgi:outer membrane protein assembly factor BamB